VSTLRSISVRVESPALSVLARENARPVLHEVRHALARLLQAGEETVIDLHGLPLGEPGEAYLLDVLGGGELECRLEASGESTIQETGYHGVWVVTHRNAAGAVIARFLEITFLPAILRSDPADVQDALGRLTARLAEEPTETSADAGTSSGASGA
jgi:hydrogenase-1 operon protein HyaF